MELRDGTKLSPGDVIDFERALTMIGESLEKAQTYFERNSEAMAAMHAAEKVMYSPIVTLLQDSRDKVEFMKFKITEGD